jgi:hypothetical protein
MNERTRCRICGNDRLVSVLDLGKQTLTGVFPRSREEKLTRGPLELVKCHSEGAGSPLECCGLVQLRHSYNAQELYGENYGYRSGLNPSMVHHLEGLVARLLCTVRLEPDDLVLDIGSNDGTLLGGYPESGPKLLGIDPTAKKFRRFYKPHIEVIENFFSADRFREHAGERRAKVISSIAMFYDLEDPADFMGQVSEVLADDGVWLFEQSYLPSMIEVNAYDTVCHEHVEYYALHQIKYLTDRAGLKIIDLRFNDVNGGSFAVTAAKADAPYPEDKANVEATLAAEKAKGFDTLKPYAQFKEKVFAHRQELVELLREIRRRGDLVIGYGASTKGNVILQFCSLTVEDVGYFAEVNQDKFGRFTPETHIPIISEAEARAMKPAYFLAMPWHFRDHLVEREADFIRGGGRMIFPLPKIEIVGGSL